MTAFKHFFAEPEIADCFSVYKKQEVNNTSFFLMIVSDIALNTIDDFNIKWIHRAYYLKLHCFIEKWYIKMRISAR